MVFFMTVLLAMSCDSQVSGSYEIVKAFPSLEFTRPVDIQHPGDGTNRLFVVEQRGVINVFDNSSNVATSSVFLDIEDRVNDGGNEEGLLGLAFHPDYENNGYFYVYYSADNPRRTVVSRYSVDATDAGTANRDSELVILEVGQPFGNHNGGQVSFGPDGYLYVGVGDGGSGGDPLGHGQNLSTLLGTILRIDVDSTVAGKNYAIPPDNPFAGNSDGYAEEIFAYGLRNPWRFSFDSETEQLWTGDVGQNDLEEIDIVESGKNYGWNIQEGGGCYEPSSGCDKTGLVQPIIDYGRRSGKSVTGGFVYRGSAVNDLQGYYIYADFVTGRIWALNASLDPVDNKELADTDLRISSFGVDASNELYIASFDGYIYQIRKKAN
ncbi:MAG: glucose sorbosone dehydrogenase [Rhodothermales bacterium]|nr:glucose sorbosone dehydrogenase [Rhodothermales bacterium]